MGLENSQAFKIGEVIEANTNEFVVRCYQLHQPPSLGSLVRTSEGSITIYGIVYWAETHSLEPGRRPIARGEKEESEEAIFSSNPQLVKLLCTDFRAFVVGHRDEASLYHYFPPKPARIHSFAYVCDLGETMEFSQSLDFLGLLLEAKLPVSVDEITAACLRHFSQAHPDSYAFLVRAGKELALLLSGDLKRLNFILKRLGR